MSAPSTNSITQGVQVLQNLLPTYKNDPAFYIADRASPVIATGKGSGLFYRYDTGLRSSADVDLWRQPGGGFERGALTPTDDTYKTKEYGYDGEIDLSKYRKADKPLDLEKDAMVKAREEVSIWRERQVASLYFTAANWTNGLVCTGGNEWNQAAPTVPVMSQLWTAIHTIRRACGRQVNTMIFGAAAWETASQVADIYGLTPSAERQSGLTESALAKNLADYFGLAQPFQVLVGKATRNTVNAGQTETIADIWGDFCWVGYVDPNPTIESPTATAQFSSYNPGQPQTVVSVYEEPAIKKRFVHVEEDRDFKVVSAVMGYLFSDITA